jgi:hypothetical protein
MDGAERKGAGGIFIFPDAKIGILGGETRYLSERVRGLEVIYAYLGEGRFGEMRYDQIRGVQVFHPEVRKIDNAKIVELLNSLNKNTRNKLK